MRWSRARAFVTALLLLAVTDPALAGAARTRPGRAGSAPSRPVERASGHATYGRGHGARWHGRSHVHVHSGYGYGFGFGSVYPGYWYWGAPYWWGPAPVDLQFPVDRDAPGAVETDVRPRRAEVRVDGDLVGQARDYDGRWDRLWLAPGDHVVELSAGGYRTLRVPVRVRPGFVLAVSERLEKGEGLDPRSREAPAIGDRAAAALDEDAEERPAPESTLRRGMLSLEIEPDDAAVYLDGEFLARAAELRRLHGALPVAAGLHTIEVVHPEYRDEKREVEVDGGERVHVAVTLERERD